MFNICYNDRIGVPHIVFNKIDCYLKKNGDYSSLIFCDNNKNKNIIYIYFKIIKQLRDKVFSLIDEFEDDDFIFGNDNFTIFRLIKDNSVIDNDNDNDSLTNFKFKTDRNLLYNKKNNIPVCVISLCSAIKKENIHYPIFRLQKCFYEHESFKKI